MASAQSTPNIALIKYWGNQNNSLRLPAADSLSMTLTTPMVKVSAEDAEQFSLISFEKDGTKKELTDNQINRFKVHLDLCRQYLSSINADELLPSALSLRIDSEIPAGIGIASSAAVFSAAAKAYAELVKDKIELNNEQISVLARLGSGSASRSIFGGYSALYAGQDDAIGSSYSTQIADENHWKLYDIIVIPSLDHKKVGSTEGHAIAQTSPHFTDRLSAIPRRMKECIEGIKQKDFEKVRSASEEDALDMHHVMETSSPPLKYLNNVTHRIIKDITELRNSDHLEVLFTMDAGPTVHLICTEDSKEKVLEFAKKQEDCHVLESNIGEGAKECRIKNEE
ncbi:MAG: diphosphomevalonate decarboxylase [Candidatus Peribacteraceae bacterium]|nr:diphosphomevalonate decarboxylase [Candidatus Peribacteraceae bacterium]